MGIERVEAGGCRQIPFRTRTGPHSEESSCAPCPRPWLSGTFRRHRPGSDGDGGRDGTGVPREPLLPLAWLPPSGGGGGARGGGRGGGAGGGSGLGSHGFRGFPRPGASLPPPPPPPENGKVEENAWCL